MGDRPCAPLALVVVMLVAAACSSGRDDGGDEAVPVYLEPAAALGDDPFLEGPTIELALADTLVLGPEIELIVVGTEPALYGGTGEELCEPSELVDFLDERPEMAAAWAAVQRIDPADIGDFVQELTPAVLLGDTWVTNHGFRKGRATARLAVFERGSAVLLDERGIPRVRCRCGNPLREGSRPPRARVVNPSAAWDGFDLDTVLTVEPGDPLGELALVDVDGGSGSADDRDVPEELDSLTFHEAVAGGRLDLVEEFLDAGQDVEAVDEIGNTPLEIAAFRPRDDDSLAEDLAMMQLLLDAGADPDATGRGGRRPIHTSAWFAPPGAVELLLDNGADLEIRDGDGETALFFAARRDDDAGAMLRFLLDEGADLRARSNRDGTALHMAGWFGGGPQVTTLVEAGLDLEDRDRDGRTPLSWAATNAVGAGALLALGADVDSRADDGSTPLHFAHLDPDVIDVLLAAGAMVDPRDENGRTPLHAASSLEHSGRSIGLLTEAGADVNARDDEGDTPLHVAMRQSVGRGSRVRALLDAGADPTIRNAAGETPVDLAPDGDDLFG